MAPREDSLGAPLLDVPLRLIRGIRQVSNGAPFEAIQSPGAYETADRVGSLAEKYGSQIQAIRQAANSGSPEAVPAAWNMLGAFRTRALQDRVPAADFDAVFEGLRKEVQSATRAQLGLGDPEGVARQALLEGEPASKLVTPLSNVIKNQSYVGVNKAREKRIMDLLPGEMMENEAQAAQAGAAAGASQARGSLYGAQERTLVPAQAEQAKAAADKSRRWQPGAGQGGAKFDDYTAEYNALDKQLAEQQNAVKTYPAPEAGALTAQVQARVARLNDLARLLNGQGFKLPDVEVRNEGGRVIVAPRANTQQTPDQRGQEWEAATGGGGGAAAPSQSGGFPAQQASEPLPPPEAPQLAPPEAPPGPSAPGDVNDLSGLLGPMAAALQQGQQVPKSQLRAQIQARGVTDRAQQDAILNQVETIYGRANAAVGR